jgi:hypothetical protein
MGFYIQATLLNPAIYMQTINTLQMACKSAKAATDVTLARMSE